MTVSRFFAAVLLLVFAAFETRAAEPAATRLPALIPAIAAYTARGMQAYDVPGLAIGIVAGDTLVHAQGFGVRAKSNARPVDPRTIFQIGSTTKAFLATSLAMLVDRGQLRWDDRVVDRYPGFQMKDPWVTREFRIYDLLAQRSGLVSLANDMLGMLDFDERTLIRSLRDVEPAYSFRATFGYTNITHLLASRIAAEAAGAPDWSDILQKDLTAPLGMTETSWTAEALEAAPNHAKGHRWEPTGSVEVPITPIFPYRFAGAGNINAHVEDMARWVRLMLSNGVFEGRHLVSEQNLAVTRMPRVALSDKRSYAMGWNIQQTPNATVVWHDGDALSYGSFVGVVPDHGVGVVILTNQTNIGFPEMLGRWILDRVLANPDIDYAALKLPEEKAQFEAAARQFAKPANPRPFPPLAPLAGTFDHPSMGEAGVAQVGDALVLTIMKTGARFKLEPWDGDVFVARLMPEGRFAAVVTLDYMTKGFAQFQKDVLTLTLADGQVFTFQRR